MTPVRTPTVPLHRSSGHEAHLVACAGWPLQAAAITPPAALDDNGVIKGVGQPVADYYRVILTCSDTELPPEGSIRLTGGAVPHIGRLEVSASMRAHSYVAVKCLLSEALRL